MGTTACQPRAVCCRSANNCSQCFCFRDFIVLGRFTDKHGDVHRPFSIICSAPIPLRAMGFKEARHCSPTIADEFSKMQCTVIGPAFCIDVEWVVALAGTSVNDERELSFMSFVKNPERNALDLSLIHI